MNDRVLAKRYRLIDKLGEGGMGCVWRAEHLTLHTLVAVKLIDSKIAESPEMLERFQREATAAAELRSTHIVQILDYGVDDGVPFIAMELLEGESLADRIDRLGKLSLEETVRVLSQVARALTRAHEKGIVHRDLKPDNVFLVREDDEELAKVLDFGIAKRLSVDLFGSGAKTHTGTLLGTPYYMSPEQAFGRSTIDHRTDIWSFAIIAHECLTGIRPFQSESIGELLVSICNDPIPIPSKLAAVTLGFDAWFARAAARDPNARYQSAADAALALRSLRDSAPVHSIELSCNARAVPTARPDPVALMQTLGAASVTVPSKPRRRTVSFRTPIALGLLMAIGALSHALWQSPLERAGAVLPKPSAVRSVVTAPALAAPLAVSSAQPMSAPPIAPSAATVGQPERRAASRNTTRTGASAHRNPTPAKVPTSLNHAGF